jgi:membrane-bound lytic murein transglycosylase B
VLVLAQREQLRQLAGEEWRALGIAERKRVQRVEHAVVAGVVPVIGLDADALDFAPATLDPVYPLAALAQRGYRPQAGEPAVDGATLLTFDGEAGKEYWLGYRNFYVITRYNRSPMYALAVQQLAQAIRAGSGGP